VIEPSDAVNAGMAVQTEGSRLELSASVRPQLDFSWLVAYGLVIVDRDRWYTRAICCDEKRCFIFESGAETGVRERKRAFF